ncbi:polysaccharide lyase [Dichotomopilus funicola]|uniref:rhamnogalacturonan endolyase n=1 Tax=Dichotomopilus funicola TaxID=1934379 RepID=A0AAN6UWL4_9PEZI|nr:polysaccharide lyase [Dichotomopilus funicola]
MKAFAASITAWLSAGTAHAAIASVAATPFLNQVDNQTWIIGNDVWNMTQGLQFGVKLYYKDRDLVGDAWGHYVSYNGAANNLAWTSARIVTNGTYHSTPFIDVLFTAAEGDMHWVIFQGQHGAYQYFINHALPDLGEFRTLWRLDNTTFPNGRTVTKDGPLPPLSEYVAANKVQDETWLAPDGKGYITKYDWTSWLREQDYYGVYGDEVGSWYINPGKDYYNGNHLRQELMVHRESGTGDAVQLNMVHGTHFTASSNDAFPDGKMWGPWLWYLNNGSQPDAAAQSHKESASWPYPWLKDPAYQTRGRVSGRLVLSDGRPASHAAVFLGDNHPNKTSLDMGSTYYYTTYADKSGRFEFRDVRTATYGLQAWPTPNSSIVDVTTTLLRNDVVVGKKGVTQLGEVDWAISNRTRVFQVGDFDRYSYGFEYGGAAWQHALVNNCPADLVFKVGVSETGEWCFGQTYLGNWTIEFDLSEDLEAEKDALLTVSLAGYSSGASSTVWVNGGTKVGNLTSGAPQLANDPSLYRSATAAGEWRLFEFGFGAGVLKKGVNTITFELTKNSTWHGFMWDSVILEL